MLRIKAEEISKVLEIVSSNYKLAEDYFVKLNNMAKAKLSIEYIKNNYLGGA